MSETKHPGPMQPMFLQEVESKKAPGPMGDRIGEMRQRGLPVPQILHLFAFKPERTGHLGRFTQETMRGPSPLSPGQRELIAAFTSSENRCPF